jgi:acetyl-CoA carboxylase biotin carboxyl carrier protein
LAALFLRAFFLRLFFAIVDLPFLPDRSGDPTILVGPPATHRGPAHGWMLTTDQREDHAMADEIRAEMVANVWKVVASAGDTIAEGDTLVILESMKMEIPVIAESDGVLKQLAVNEGDVVQEGDLIAVIE